MPENTTELAVELESICRTLFKHDRPTTAVVAKAFGDLGIDKGLYVCSRTYKPCTSKDIAFVDGEWLYDLCWYSATDGIFDDLMLVVESELSRLQSASVDNDFGKLVQCRAGVRVWIAKARGTQIIDDHIEACIKSARAFRGSCKGDVYLFALYDEASKRTITRISKL